MKRLLTLFFVLLSGLTFVFAANTTTTQSQTSKPVFTGITTTEVGQVWASVKFIAANATTWYTFYVQYWKSSSTLTSQVKATGQGNTFYANFTWLVANTKYYYRIYAKSSTVAAVSSIYSFTTKAATSVAPKVSSIEWTYYSGDNTVVVKVKFDRAVTMAQLNYLFSGNSSSAWWGIVLTGSSQEYKFTIKNVKSWAVSFQARWYINNVWWSFSDMKVIIIPSTLVAPKVSSLTWFYDWNGNITLHIYLNGYAKSVQVQYFIRDTNTVKEILDSDFKDSINITSSNAVEFQTKLSNMSVGKTLYYRARAYNGLTGYFSDTKSLKIQNASPVFTGITTTEVGQVWASVKFIAANATTWYTFYVQYWKSSSTLTSQVKATGQGNTFYANFTWLVANTKYYYRIYAKSSTVAAVSSIYSFTTKAATSVAPKVSSIEWTYYSGDNTVVVKVKFDRAVTMAQLNYLFSGNVSSAWWGIILTGSSQEYKFTIKDMKSWSVSFEARWSVNGVWWSFSDMNVILISYPITIKK